MWLRELVGVLAILAGVILVGAALIASGWWALAFLGGSALTLLGLGAVVHRVPEDGDRS